MIEAELTERLSEIERTAKEQGYVLRVTLHEPADDTSITWAESQLGLLLPASFRSFLKLHNGLELATVDETLGPNVIMCRLRILGAAEIVRYRNGEDDESRYRRPPVMAPVNRAVYERGIPLGNYEGGSNFLLFDPDRGAVEYPVIDAYTETDDPWLSVASSFEEFLGQVLECAMKRGDFTYWIGQSP